MPWKILVTGFPSTWMLSHVGPHLPSSTKDCFLGTAQGKHRRENINYGAQSLPPKHVRSSLLSTLRTQRESQEGFPYLKEYTLMPEIQAQGDSLATHHPPPCSWSWPDLHGTGGWTVQSGKFPLGASSSSGADSRGPF